MVNWRRKCTLGVQVWGCVVNWFVPRFRRLSADPWCSRVAVIACAAVVLRWLLVVLLVRPCPTPEKTFGNCLNFYILDRGYYFWQGLLIGEGHFFKNGLLYSQTGELADSAVAPPGFPLLLGSWSALGFDSVASQLLLLGLLGGVTTVAIAALTRRLAGDTAGVIAAVIAALHPLLWINDTTLRVESLYQLVIVLLMISAYVYIDNPRSSRAAITGALTGLAALVRSEALLLSLFLLVPLMMITCRKSGQHQCRAFPAHPPEPVTMMTCRKLGQLLGHLLIAGTAAVAVISPWIAYLNATYEKPVLLNTSSGWTLLDGSCDAVWHGEWMGLWGGCFLARGLHEQFEAEFPGIELRPSKNVGSAKYGNPIRDASELDAFHRSHALEYIGDNLSRYPLVMLVRLARMFGVHEPMDTITKAYSGFSAKAYSGFSPPWLRWHQLGQVLYTLLLIPTAVGAHTLRRNGKPLTPLLSVLLAVAVTAALAFAVPRYRVPVDIIVIVLASVAFAHWPKNKGIMSYGAR